MVIRWAHVRDDGEEEREEVYARLVAADAAIARIDELAAEPWTRDDTADRMRALYAYRRRRFAARKGIEEDDGFEERADTYQRMVHDVIAAQRAALLGLRNRGEISSEVMRHVERDLDLEETRLEI
jgi:CPA1 family monovalent cation:H+ antiporter